MPTRVPFTLVDVFTTVPFAGNQLAVFTDADGLGADKMQALAHEMNFSECVFLLAPSQPGALRRLRIFTPRQELMIAGHPTVGAAWVLAAGGAVASGSPSTDVTLELGNGPIGVSIDGAAGQPEFVWMTHRDAVFGAVRRDRARIARMLGIAASDIRSDLPIRGVSTGNPFLFVPLVSVEALGRCRCDPDALAKILVRDPDANGLYLFVPGQAPGFAVRARMFSAPGTGLSEDPATGSAAAPLGCYLARQNVLPPAEETEFIVEQGIEMGRPSRIHVKVSRRDRGGLSVRIGGHCVVIGDGAVTVPD
jgi:trans-2,3-dihydro-3-hydroxyanthranilate isomerase